MCHLVEVVVGVRSIICDDYSQAILSIGHAGPLRSLCMYLLKEYARTATTEADNKRNIHDIFFLSSLYK